MAHHIPTVLCGAPQNLLGRMPDLQVPFHMPEGVVFFSWPPGQVGRGLRPRPVRQELSAAGAPAARAQGLEIVPSVANFVLVKVGDGARVFGELQKRGVIVRPMRPYGMPEWLRVTVGTTAQNERLLTTLAAVLKAERG